MADETQQVRVHLTVPGPRSGVPYAISVETINCADLNDGELQLEVRAAVVAYDEAKRLLDERVKTE